MNKFRGECEIEIGGAKRKLLINMHTYALVCEGMKISIDEFDKAMSDSRQPRAFMWLIFSALQTACEAYSKEVDFTYFDVADWLIDVDQEEINKVVDTIESSASTNLPKDKGTDTDKKK